MLRIKILDRSVGTYRDQDSNQYGPPFCYLDTIGQTREMNLNGDSEARENAVICLHKSSSIAQICPKDSCEKLYVTILEGVARFEFYGSS